MGMRTAILVLVLGAATAVLGAWYWRGRPRAEKEYLTAKVQRGDLVSTINATGTLEPEEVIDVGAQVAGLIQAFGKDADGKQIDYRSPVEADTVLARIDDAVYKADVDTARAQLEQANASRLKGDADLVAANAKLFQAEQNWNRAKDMGPSDALSQNDYTMYQAEFETAKANVAVAQAEIAQSKAAVSQAQASLAKAQRNFDFCTIKSPVKGVIIDRRVNIGQTVVSSLNAPSLFLIAKDLTRMQIWVSVNEADIGRIAPGTAATFRCDAFPGRTFQGTVGKVRLNATMTQNVVMYTVEVNTENADSLLIPYLTANVQFAVQTARGALLLPNAALRWTPNSAAEVSPASRATWKPEGAESSGAENAESAAAKDRDGTPKRRTGTVWIPEGGFVRPIEVELGPTDGTNTIVQSGSVVESQDVIVGEALPENQVTDRNPFLPTLRRR
jgi:HlyD family secretion protein